MLALNEYEKLPIEIWNAIFSLFRTNDLVLLRTVSKLFCRYIDQMLLTIGLKNIAKDLGDFFKELQKYYGGKIVPELVLQHQENSAMSSLLNCEKLSLDAILKGIKTFHSVENSKKSSVKNQELLTVFEFYIGQFDLYNKKLNRLASKLKKINEDKAPDEEVKNKSESELKAYLESIYMHIAFPKKILLKNDSAIEYFSKMALVDPLSKKILSEFCKLNSDKADSYIPTIVTAIFSKRLNASDLRSMVIIKRRCYYRGHLSWKFYLSPEQADNFSVDMNFTLFGSLYFKQLYELRFLWEIVGDYYTPLLAKIKTEIMNDSRFNTVKSTQGGDNPLEKIFDEIARIALMCDNYPKNDQDISLKEYSLETNNEDAISSSLSRYWR